MKNVTFETNARALALELLLAVAKKRQSLDELLPQIYGSALEGADKGFARQLLMTTLRHHGQLGAITQGYLERPLEEKHLAVEWLLRMGAAQLMLLQTPPHAAIDTSVQLCKQLGFMHQAGLVNAVLRKVSTDKPELPPATYNLPSWLKGAWRKAYGREVTDAMAGQFLVEPPLDVTLNPKWAFEAEAGQEEILQGTVRMANGDVSALDGYAEGAFWVQDVAASLPVRALGEVKGKCVLDLCAAPGGKTLQLASAGAEVVAVDRSAMRLKRVSENLQRIRLAAALLEADLTEWQPQGHFEAVLLDAPCSATGTVRRHPDLLLRKSEKDIAEMVALQRAILAQVMTWLPVGVPLVYCVCSLQPEEGKQQMEWLLAEYPALKLEPIEQPDWPREWFSPEGLVRTLPHFMGEKGGMDGFFIAKFIRTE